MQTEKKRKSAVKKQNKTGSINRYFPGLEMMETGIFPTMSEEQGVDQNGVVGANGGWTQHGTRTADYVRPPVGQLPFRCMLTELTTHCVRR